MQTSAFWSSICESLTSFREEPEDSADPSSSSKPAETSQTLTAFKLTVWQALAGHLNQMLPDAEADIPDSGGPLCRLFDKV